MLQGYGNGSGKIHVGGSHDWSKMYTCSFRLSDDCPNISSTTTPVLGSTLFQLTFEGVYSIGTHLRRSHAVHLIEYRQVVLAIANTGDTKVLVPV